MAAATTKCATSWPKLIGQIQTTLQAGLGGSGKREMSAQLKATVLGLLHNYDSNPRDFEQYVRYDSSGYTKNLVRELPEGLGNIIVMCWSPGQSSAVHGHEGSRCFVKVLAGELLERRFQHPLSADGAPAQVFAHEGRLEENDVAYIDDSIGCHQVSNERDDLPAITLHIYAPPYRKCRIFEQPASGAHLSTGGSKVIDVALSAS